MGNPLKCRHCGYLPDLIEYGPGECHEDETYEVRCHTDDCPVKPQSKLCGTVDEAYRSWDELMALKCFNSLDEIQNGTYLMKVYVRTDRRGNKFIYLDDPEKQGAHQTKNLSIHIEDEKQSLYQVRGLE